MTDLEIREFKNTIINYINEIPLSIELKRLIINEIALEVKIKAEEVILEQLNERNNQPKEEEPAE